MDRKPIMHLIVDYSAFSKNAAILDTGNVIYTLPDVINEKCDKALREHIKSLPMDLILRNPSLESLRIVTMISKRTGDYNLLTALDLKMIALVYDIQVQQCGAETVDCEPAIKVYETTLKDGKIFINQDCDEIIDERKVNKKDDDAEWITQKTFDDVLLRYNSGITSLNKSNEIKVACLTDVFPIQNTLFHMKINIVSLDGMLIKELSSFILRCRSCFQIIPVVTKEFCPNCGNQTLERVFVTANGDGVMRVYIDFDHLCVTRGFRHSTKKILRGRHQFQERLFEDQKLSHNRMAKVNNNLNIDLSPFVPNDVNSRSARIGIRSLINAQNRKNPNESCGGKRRKK